MRALRQLMSCGVLAAAILMVAVSANAQVNGQIIGTVTDQTQGVLPGVTVTVTSPALMGTRTDVTGGDGAYRMPNLPPGEYSVVFELPGFGTFKREGVRIDVGFTATINATMGPATVQETVTVSGESPVVDVTASRVTTHLDADQLANQLVGSRDYAAVMSQVPGVLNTRMDVGGSNATTMQAYRAYGLSGGRGEIEGINSSMFGSGGLLGYSDMESFDDMAVNVTGNSAEMAVPGAFVNVVSKSGGNAYHGQTYFDYQHHTMGTTNIDDALIARGLTAAGGAFDVHDLNRFDLFRDFSANTGGYFIKDKLWWFGAYRNTRLDRRYPVLLDDIAITTLPAYTGKLTYNITSNHKVTAYSTHSNKIFWNYNVGSVIVTSEELTDEHYPNATTSFSYEALLGRSAVLTVRAGHWGDYGDYAGKSDKQRYEDSGANRYWGSVSTRIDERDRPQANGSLTYFKDGWAGSHSFKVGGEFQHEQQKYSITKMPNNMVLYLNNNVPTQVDVYLVPSSNRSVGRSKGAYFSDSWRVNSQLTLNLGLRFDQYTAYVPPQTGPQGHDFSQLNGPKFNALGPRAGFVYSLTEDGKTLVKANFGKYWENPGYPLASAANPNPNNNYTRYEWVNPNPKYNADGLPIFEGPQQLGRVISVTGARADFSPLITWDPNLKDDFTKTASTYFEREIAANFGIRTGFVWNGVRNPRTTVNINQPYEAFNQPVSIQNPGPDGRAGTADDGANITAYNLDPALLSLPVVQQVKNGYVSPSDYYTWEITATKRQSNKWSLLASFSEMWSREGVTLLTPNARINTTDGRDKYKEYQIRLSSTLELPGGINFTPIVRAQAGRPYSPTFNARLNYNTSVAIKAAPRGEQSNDNITLMDMRATKVIRLPRQMSLRAFVDVYNIFNTNAVQEMTVSYGANFRRPTTISGPRIARVGLRFEF